MRPAPGLVRRAAQRRRDCQGGGLRGRRSDPRAALRPAHRRPLSRPSRPERLGRAAALRLQPPRPDAPRSGAARRAGDRRAPGDPVLRRALRPRAAGAGPLRPLQRGGSAQGFEAGADDFLQNHYPMRVSWWRVQASPTARRLRGRRRAWERFGRTESCRRAASRVARCGCRSRPCCPWAAREA